MPPEAKPFARYYDKKAEIPSEPTEEDDPRSPWERDRDRVLHSSAFRRLAGVTQVVSPTEGHVFHNRLTHTLKVAQISHGIADRLLRFQKDLVEKAGGLHPFAAEAAALAHDLGHPPFGHVAEHTLNHLLEAHGAEHDGFEGNAQSFRIVTKLSVRDKDKKGLDLTCATLNGMLKYPCMRSLTEGNQCHDKWGVYSTETGEFGWVRSLQTPGKRTLEAEIMDWADDIAYSVHDLEDFYRAGLIPLDRLKIDQKERESFVDGVKKRWQRGPKKHHNIDAHKREFETLLEKVIPIVEPYRGERDQRVQLRTVTAGFIEIYIRGFTLARNPESGVVEVARHIQSEMQIRMLKELTWHYVIENPAMARQQHGEKKIIKDLFTTFLQIIEDEHSDYTIFPNGVKKELEAIDQAETDGVSIETTRYARLRLIADTISGMTDTEAWRIHRRLTGIDAGSTIDYTRGR